MDAYDDYVGRWSDACRAGGGTVEGNGTVRLFGPPGNLPVYGVVRFVGTAEDAATEVASWKARGAPFTFTTDDPAIAQVLAAAGMVPKNRFGLVTAPVRDLGTPEHEVEWTDDMARVMEVQAVCHDIPPFAVAPAIEAMRAVHAEGKEHFVVVEEGGKAVGSASIYVGRGNAGLYAASVLPSHRRKGIARSMMQALMAKAAELGLRQVVATTTHDGTALSLALGAEVAGELQQFAWFPEGGSRGTPKPS